MKSAQIKSAIKQSFKHKPYWFWFGVRAISASGPILITYIFSQVIETLETHQTFVTVVNILLVLLGVQLVENILRISSKVNLDINMELILINIQKVLVENISTHVQNRKEEVQAIRNITRAVMRFAQQVKDSGINSIVSVVSIPIILFFIDKRIFLLEIGFIATYSFLSYVFTKKYEKNFEKLDKSQEFYFAKLMESNEVENEAGYLRRNIRKVQNNLLVNWFTYQNLNAFFQFIVAYLIIVDIVAGTKHISDLVLIIGYTRESQIFLNSFTIMNERFMEIKAGIERMVAVSNKKEISSILT